MSDANAPTPLTLADAVHLAHAAGVAPALVDHVESGVRVTGDEGRAILSALGVDPAPYVAGTPHGAVHVSAVDAAHSQMMAYLTATADHVDDGWIVFPDVSAFLISHGYVASEHERVRTHKATEWPGQSKVALGLLLIGFAAVTTCFAYDVGCHFGVWKDFLDPTLPGTVAVLSTVLGSSSALAAYTYPGQGVTRSSLPLAVLDMTVATSDVMRRQAHVVSPRGVVSFRLGERGVERVERLAAGIRSVRVKEEDAAHVTLDLDTVVGPLHMPWLPRTRDLLDLVETWRSAGAAACLAYLEGPQ